MSAHLSFAPAWFCSSDLNTSLTTCSGLTLPPSRPPELEELRQALKWTQHCLTDTQSQQDVELVMQLLFAEDFQNAYSIYATVSQQKSPVSPTSPLTVQAEDLCQEVGTVRISLGD